MLFGKKKTRQTTPDFNEDDIQDEIRKRILKESQAKSGIENSRESTRATLDALEDMVSLSREEMESIADQVRAEFQQKKEKTGVKRRRQNAIPRVENRSKSKIPWVVFILLVGAFFFTRRGFSWRIILGIILIFTVWNIFFNKPPSE